MIVAYILVLITSFYFLAVICEEFFVPALDIISRKLKLSSDVAGATLMAVGSSAPEFFTALFAVFMSGGHADVGSGTIVGSAIFNILVIIGAVAAFRETKLTWQPVVRDAFFYSLTILLLLFVFWDGRVTLIESIYFVIFYIIYIFAVANWKKLLPYKDVDPVHILEEGIKKSRMAQISKKLFSLIIPDCEKRPSRYLSSFVISIIIIAVLSYLLVESAVGIGEIFKISPVIIALTVLAAGTSIPDLFSSIIVAKQGRGDMAVSNAVGSNIFDILFGLGFPWMLVMLIKGGTVTVGTESLLSSVFLLFATVISILFILVVRKFTIGRRAGWALIAVYFAYLGYQIIPIVI